MSVDTLDIQDSKCSYSVFLILASILNAPYPPPDLWHPKAEKIQTLPSVPPQTETPPAAATPAQPAAAPTSTTGAPKPTT